MARKAPFSYVGRCSLLLMAALLSAATLPGIGCGPQGGEGPAHRPQTLALTPEQEYELGVKAYKEVLSKAHVVRSGPDVERIREIGGRIARAAEIEPLQREINLHLQGYRFDWEFNLLESKQVNAFCLPGGKVAVFTGLLPVAENDDELATVMSHEIAHALAHHASERIARAQMYEHAVNAVNGVMGNLDPENRERLIGLLGAGASVRSMAYDRQQESEADHIASGSAWNRFPRDAAGRPRSFPITPATSAASLRFDNGFPRPRPASAPSMKETSPVKC